MMTAFRTKLLTKINDAETIYINQFVANSIKKFSFFHFNNRIYISTTNHRNTYFYKRKEQEVPANRTKKYLPNETSTSTKSVDTLKQYCLQLYLMGFISTSHGDTGCFLELLAARCLTIYFIEVGVQVRCLSSSPSSRSLSISSAAFASLL